MVTVSPDEIYRNVFIIYNFILNSSSSLKLLKKNARFSLLIEFLSTITNTDFFFFTGAVIIKRHVL